MILTSLHRRPLLYRHPHCIRSFLHRVYAAVDRRVQSTQLTNQCFWLLNGSHRGCSENLRRYTVPPVLQAHQPQALIETVTGHKQREAALLGSPPSVHSGIYLRPIPVPTIHWWRSDTSRLPRAYSRSSRLPCPSRRSSPEPLLRTVIRGSTLTITDDIYQ